jgi:hypothetical protein
LLDGNSGKRVLLAGAGGASLGIGRHPLLPHVGQLGRDPPSEPARTLHARYRHSDSCVNRSEGFGRRPMATPDLTQTHRPSDVDLPTKEIDFYGTDSGPFGKSIAQDTLDLMVELRSLGFAEHVGEMAVQGLTVIPPHKVTTPEMVRRLRDKLFFQQIVLNPTILAMTNYVCGKNAVLSILDGLIKGPAIGDLTLHADHFMTPPPMSQIANQVNNFLVLTDIDRESGALASCPAVTISGASPCLEKAWTSGRP